MTHGRSEPVAEIVRLHPVGAVVADARGEGRALRTTWHRDEGVVVLSIWREGTCRATVRLRPDDVPDLVETLTRGLVDPATARAAASAG